MQYNTFRYIRISLSIIIIFFLLYINYYKLGYKLNLLYQYYVYIIIVTYRYIIKKVTHLYRIINYNLGQVVKFEHERNS